MRRIFLATIGALLCACSGPAPTPVSDMPPPSQTQSAEPPPAAAPAAQCVPAAYRLCPSEQAVADPAFAQFRQQLRDAVRDRNDAVLMALVDPKVRVSFGDGGGYDAFRKAWNLPSADSALWTELEQILALGGSFRGEPGNQMFWAPYVYSSWPEAIDAFEHVAAVRGDVVLFQKADSTSPQLAPAGWAILKVLRDPDELPAGAWRHVSTLDGREGWVRSSEVRSPIGYRAGFSNRSGHWKLEALVAGD